MKLVCTMGWSEILDFMDVIARGWATDHAVEPKLLAGWGMSQPDAENFSFWQENIAASGEKPSLVSVLFERNFWTGEHRKSVHDVHALLLQLVALSLNFMLDFFRALLALGFVQNFHGNWWFVSLENWGLQRFLCMLSLASASRLNLVSVSTLALQCKKWYKTIQSATAGQSHDIQVVIPGIEQARSQNSLESSLGPNSSKESSRRNLDLCCILLLWFRGRCSPYQIVLLKVKRCSFRMEVPFCNWSHSRYSRTTCQDPCA